MNRRKAAYLNAGCIGASLMAAIICAFDGNMLGVVANVIAIAVNAYIVRRDMA